MKWFRWSIEFSFKELDWKDVEACMMRNGAGHPKVIRMTGPCLPGIN